MRDPKPVQLLVQPFGHDHRPGEGVRGKGCGVEREELRGEKEKIRIKNREIR